MMLEYDIYIKIIFIIMKIFPKMTSKSVLFQFGGLIMEKFAEGEINKTCLN